MQTQGKMMAHRSRSISNKILLKKNMLDRTTPLLLDQQMAAIDNAKKEDEYDQ
ncbi:hypothetical protein GBA52_002733 [Prunus armeniaca]|nr:hypothetical protein GBA52_002733 [Prunus armeniaca]